MYIVDIVLVDLRGGAWKVVIVDVAYVNVAEKGKKAI